jgi:TRAP-type uncharacterized transport system substrate-binding protein
VTDPHTATPSRRRIAVAVLAALAALAALGWAVAGRNALPPRSIVMATGPEGGSYAALAERYREGLARHGLEVELRPTDGDAENLALLQDPRSGVRVAFLQAGTTTEERSPRLASLGTVSIQPIWVFRHGDVPPAGLSGLAGKTLAAGKERSGTRALLVRLLALTGTDPRQLRLEAMPPFQAADALERGEIDGMALVASWDSPLVRRLVAAPGVTLDAFPRADAYVALDPSLEKVVLPQGVGSLAANRPPRDVPLLATKVSLVVPRDVNPAIQFLLLDVASDVHGGPGLFQRAGQFPAAEGADLPISPEARHFYRSGRPFLQRYLPYWVAVLAERLLLVLLPVLGVLLPLVRLVPFLYHQVMERRVIRLYGELKILETEVQARAAGADRSDLTARLDALEARADALRVPENFALMRYTLKQHIDLVRVRIGERPPARPRALA